MASLTRLAVVLVAVVAAALLLALYLRPPVSVEDVRYTYTGMVAGVFMTVENRGLSSVCIVDARLEGADARVEIHETVREGGAYGMRPVEGVCVPPMGSVEFRPRGLHVMVMGGVDPGGSTLVLVLDDGREVRVKLPEEPVAPGPQG